MHRWRLHLLRIDLRPFPLPKSSTAYTAECSHSSPDPTGRAWLCSDTSRPLLRSGKATRPAFRPGVPFLSRGAQPVVACCIKKLQLRTAGRPRHPRSSGARWLSNDPKPQSTFTNPFPDITITLQKHCQCCRSIKPQQIAARPWACLCHSHHAHRAQFP